MKRWLPLAAALALTTIPGCLRTPESLCYDYVAGIQRVIDYCGIGIHFDVRWPDGRIGCEGVARVSEAEDIVQECLPWTESEEPCDQIAWDPLAEELTLPAFCDSRRFQVHD